ncbi:MAG: cytochrome ubiquinol oxidase subunit I [Verrucomicrobia bacterium]|nr:cytochrome ubiquinol oxidase subunit I [Verrucomicrobiota bacterium]
MDALTLARLQFAFTIGFHYLFPPLSIGLGLLLVLMEGTWLKTKNPVYHQMARYWTRVFGLVFAIGVATGIVMEFEFGTNWAVYSRFVGDVFGSALAAEGIFAFFLESGFLALLLFGWDRVGPKTHFFATCMVAFGAHFSAVWIIVANSWQQTPAGFHLVNHAGITRAEITDFWAMVFNPSSMDRLIHTVCGAWQAGAWMVVSVSAWYLLKGKYLDFAKRSLQMGLVVALAASLFQLYTGHDSAVGVSQNQPAKLAAFEAHYPTAPASLYLFGWVDEAGREVRFGLAIPKMLSFLIYGDGNKPVRGLNEFAPADRPPVNVVFQTYHAMVAIGLGLIGLALLSTVQWWRGKLFEQRWLLGILVLSVLGPQMANQLGWASAEIGRQPWIVYGLLRTSDSLSKVVSGGAIVSSLIMFSLVYALLFAVFIFLLNHKIQHGPDEADLTPVGPLRKEPRADV